MSAQRVMSEPHPDELIEILSIHKKDPNPETAGRDPRAEMRPDLYQPASHIFSSPSFSLSLSRTLGISVPHCLLLLLSTRFSKIQRICRKPTVVK